MINSISGEELKKKLLNGVSKLSTAVVSTLGPAGRNVLYKNSQGKISITKDGVTVAKSFTQLEDDVEDMGMQLVKSVAIAASDVSGDGTTTATLLASFMITEGFRQIDSNRNPVEIKKGIDIATEAVVNKLKVISQDVTDKEQIKQVATISGNNDEKIGTLISNALEEVGNDGIVVIEQNSTGETYLEIVEGMLLERGYKSPFLVTDNGRMHAVLNKPNIFIFDGRITSANDIAKVMEANGVNDSLLVIAEDIDGEALATIIVNKVRGQFKICAIKAPDFGDRRLAILEDIAVLTGGKVLSENKGNVIQKMSLAEIKANFGRCRVSTITDKDTTIADGAGSAEDIEQRFADLKTQIDNAKTSFEKQHLQERLSKLSGGVAIINVGAVSEVELSESKDRIDDALHAAKAAAEEGIVPGGGIALLNCEDAVRNIRYENDDQKIGGDIVLKALSLPLKTILTNAGFSEKMYIEVKDAILKDESVEYLGYWYGYDVKKKLFVDMKEYGIIDPTKVTRSALQNAASVAGTFLTTGNAIYTIAEKSEAPEIDYSQYD